MVHIAGTPITSSREAYLKGEPAVTIAGDNRKITEQFAEQLASKDKEIAEIRAKMDKMDANLARLLGESIRESIRSIGPFNLVPLQIPDKPAEKI